LTVKTHRALSIYTPLIVALFAVVAAACTASWDRQKVARGSPAEAVDSHLLQQRSHRVDEVPGYEAGGDSLHASAESLDASAPGPMVFEVPPLADIDSIPQADRSDVLR